MMNSATDLVKNKLSETMECDLIRGDFSAEEALEILNYLIDKKINFHQVKTFSSEIRFGLIDQKSKTRCEELKQSKASIKEMAQLAMEQGKSLRIRSSVNIEIL